MNSQCFKNVFSKRLGCLVAVGEHNSNQGKATGVSGFTGGASQPGAFWGALGRTFSLVALVWATPVWAQPAANALPTGGQVVQGSVQFNPGTSQLNILQSTDRAAVNWQSFNIGSQAKVQVHQPSTQSVLLNRVTGESPSQIFGQLQANGKVILVNPNGVLFGKDGSVNANSFTASTLGITDANFMAGNMVFERNGSTAGVVNQGNIKTTGGYVALLGASVSNEGKIETQGGTAYLAAAETVKIPVSGSGRIKLELSPSRINAAVANAKSGTIVTEGGQVYMQAAALNNVVASIFQSGEIDTSGVQGGQVHVLADGGHIRVDGQIKANSTGTDDKGQRKAGGDIVIGRDEDTNVLAAVGDASGAQLESLGGFVETSGHFLKVNDIQVKAKDWLLDPNDIRIVATDTATADTRAVTASGTTTYQDNTGILASEVLKSNLEAAINSGTNVTISTANPTAGADAAGNITIETPLSFNNTGAQAATLRLFAVNGITQNSGSTISATGSQLVHIDMAAEGRYMGSTNASTNSLGITLNSAITTNGDVTLSGQARHTVANQGVGVTGLSGAGITARNIAITGNSATGYEINYQGGLTTTGGGNVTLTGNSLSLTGNPVSAGAGTVTIQNRSSGTLIDVGEASSDVLSGILKLGVSSSELALINAGSVVVGRKDDSGSGNVAINAVNLNAMGNTNANLSVLSGSSIAVNGAITKTAGTDAALNLLANANITASSTITGSSGKLNVVLNSDSDGLNGGGIVFNTGSGVTSNGGNISLGGGTALNGSGTASGDGVSTSKGIALTSANFNAGGGNIAMTGSTWASAPSAPSIQGITISNGSIQTSGAGTINLTGYNTTTTNTNGVALSLGGVTITGGSTGSVSLTGDARAASTPGSYLYGLAVGSGTTVTSSGGNISLTGYGGNGSGGNATNIGVAISGGVVAGVGAGTVTISGTGGQGSAGQNWGVWTNTAATSVTSQGGDINITGQGGNGSNSEGIVLGGGMVGVSAGTTSANVILTSDSTKIQGSTINSGTGTTTIQNKTAGTLINVGGADVLNTSPPTLGVTNAEMNLITAGTLKIGSTNTGAMTTSAAVTTAATTGNVYLQSGSTLAASHAIASGAGLYLQTTGGALSNSAALSGTNISLDNSAGSINLATGAITNGAGITAATDGITVGGSLNATTNLNVYGASGSANGINTSANWSGQYINAIGTTTTGYTGFSWNGGSIDTTGTGGASAASTIKGISAASTTASNGYGALMMFANGATNAAAGTTLTLAGEATTLTTGQNTKQRGILVQGGRTLTMSGEVTLDGSSKSSEGIAFGGTVNMTAVAGVTNKLTLKGTAAASSNSSLNAVSMSGVINSNASTSSITLIGDAKNLSGTSWDRGVNISGAINGGTANVNIQTTGANITTSAAIAGANISIDNTNGSINATSGAITVGSAGAGSAVGISVGGNITATDNLNMWGTSTNNTGINVLANKSLSGGNIQATGRVNNGGYGLLLNAGSSVITTGTSGNSLVKGINTNGGSNAVLTGGTPTLTAATGTTLTVWGDGTNTGDRAMRVDGGATTNGAVTIKGTSNNATSLMLINGAVTANANSALTLSGATSASNQSAVYFVNGGGVALKNGATLNITGQNTTSSGAGTGVLIQGGGIYKAAGATSAGAVSITGSVSSGTAGSTGVSVQAGVSTGGNIDIQGNVASAASTGVSITSSGGVASSGTNATINMDSNFGITHAGYMNVSGATGTGSNINLTSTNNSVSGTGTIGDTTNKNISVTLTQAGSSTYSGAINAANFTKAGAGALTLDSWVRTTPVATNISNAYTVKDGGSLTLSPGSTYAQLNPSSVNVENASTFSINSAGNGWWKGTAFKFTGATGGGTMNLGGNPIGASGFTNTFSTGGGGTNTVNGLFNANSANVNFNLTNATSGTALLDGSFAAIAFTQSVQGGYGLQNAATVNMSGGGHLLFKDKVGATNFNINEGNVQVGDSSAATSAATATLDATNISIAVGSKLTFNRAEAYSNSSVITGTGNLVQAGTGVVTLTGNSSAFAGSTTVNSGKTLAIGTGGSLGAAGSTLVLAGATSSLQFTESSGTSTVGSIISGSGTLSHNGEGIGVLTANNDYTGTSTVSGGTLQIGNGGTTGTLGIGGSVTLSNNANLSFLRSAETTIGNSISGTGNVSASITGTSSTLTVSSPINLTNGTVNLAADNNLSVTAAIGTTNTTSSAVLLNAGASTNAGNSTGGNLLFSGSGGVTVGLGGIATLMTGDVSGSTGLTALVGSGSGKFRYNSDETTSNYTTALDTGLYGIYREAPILTATLNNVSKTYDDASYSGGSGIGTLLGYVNGDTAAQMGSITYGGTAQSANNAGSYTLTGTAVSAVGYAVSLTAGTLTVNKANLTLSGTRDYDASTNFAGQYLTATGVNSETFTITGAGDATNLSSKNVQAGSVLASVTGLTLGASSNGGLSDNYNALSTIGSSVSVTQKAASYTATATNLTYNGALQNQMGSTKSGFINGDALTFTGEASGTHANTYASNLQVSGADANNYNVTVTNSNLIIGKANLTLSGTRVYDQGTTFAGTYLTASGVNAESFTVTGSGSNTNLSSKNVQTAQALSTVTGLTLGVSNGTNAALSDNYNSLSAAGSSVSVTTKSATVDATPTTLTYNGLTQSQQAATSSGFISGDAITITGLATGKNFGSYSSALAVSGADAGNYNITRNEANLQITKATLTATGNSSTVTYNGFNQSVAADFDVTGLQGSDTKASLSSIVAVGATGKNAGNYANLVTAGTETNYTVTPVNGNLQIGKASLTATGNSASVTYNGATQTVAGFTVSGLLGSDLVGDLTSISAAGASGQNVASYTNTVTAGLENNYTVSTVNGSLQIGKANLVLSGTKVYNASTSFAGSDLTATGAAGQTFTVTGSGNAGNLASKNVQSGQLLATVTGLALGTSSNGGLSANYNDLSTTGSSVNVTPAAATVTGTVTNVTYNGAVQTQSAPTSSGFFGGDVITASGLATGKNAGNYTSALAVGGPDAGNYTVTYTNLDLVVGQAPLSVTASQVTKTYDGGLGASGHGTMGVLAGAGAGDVVNSAGAQAFLDKDAGVGKTVRASGVTIKDAANADMTGNYAITYVDNTTSVINKAALTASLVGPISKQYDGTVAVNGLTNSNFSVTGWRNAGEGVTVNLSTASYASPNVAANGGTGAVSTALLASDFSVNGATNLANYTLPSTANGNVGTITPAPLTVKVNNTAMFVTQNPNTAFDQGFTYTGLKNGETGSAVLGSLTRTYTGAANPAAGSYSEVYGLTTTPTAANYTVTVQKGDLTVARADQLLLNVGSASATYGALNAGNAAAITTLVTAQYCLVSTDCNAGNIANLTMSNPSAGRWTATDSANSTISFNTVVDTSGQISGAGFVNVGHYGFDVGSLTTTGSVNFNGSVVSGGVLTVTPKALTLNASNVTKVYDGTTSLAGMPIGLTGSLTGDQVSVTSSGGNFAGKNAGSQNFSLTGLQLQGADRANYTFSTNTVSGTGTITPKTLALSASASDKVYDGNATASVSALGVSGVIAGDTVSATGGTASFSDKNVARNAGGSVIYKSVSITGVTLTGADAANYQTDASASASATITPLTISASVTAQNKVYDGTAQAQVSGTAAGTLGSDAVSVTSTSSSFASKNVVRDASGQAISQSVNVAGLTIAGADAGNYNLASTTASSFATITPKVLSANGAVADKVYDGSAQASLTGLNGSGIVNGDAVTVQASNAAFSDKNVSKDSAGTVLAKTVTVTGLSITGVDAHNYTLMGSSFTGQARILPRNLSIVATVQDKAYDGTAAATGGLSANAIVAGDALLLSWDAGRFASKDVSRNAQGQVQAQEVSFGNVRITGADLGNYTLDIPGNSNANTTITVSTTATINPKTLQTSGTTVADKAEDGNTTAAVTMGSLVGLVGTEQLTAAATGSFDSATAGSNKPVQVRYQLLDGLNAGKASNYNLPTEVMFASITSPSKSSGVQPIILPSQGNQTSPLRVFFVKEQAATKDAAIATIKIEEPQACSILSLEDCACEETQIKGVEICYMPLREFSKEAEKSSSILQINQKN